MSAFTRWLLEASASTRVRITAVAVAIVAVGLTVGAVVLVRVQRETLTANVEATIRVRGDDLAGLILSNQLPETLGQRDAEIAAVQVFNSSGRLVSSTANAAVVQRISHLEPAPGAAPVQRTRQLPIDDEPFLVLARTVETPTDTYTVYVAATLEPVEESVEALTMILSTGTPALILLLGAGIWIAVGRTLAPVEAMRREVAAISRADLRHRVPEPRGGDEIARLARTMNAMLARLEDAAERQGRFVADAAHELRSPLASILTQLEVRKRAGETGREVDDLLAEILRLHRLADDLLLLAEADVESPPARDLVDLDDVLLDEVARLRDETARSVDARAVSAGQLRGDAEQLRRVVRNLLDNANRHAAGRVRVALTERDGMVELSVADDGPGIPTEERERVFNRFVRLDDARSRGSGGSGLGLAITRAIVEAHGGTVAVGADESGGARFTVRLPANSQSPGAGS